LTLFDSISREATYITGIGRSLIRMRHVKPDSPITIVDIVTGFANKAPNSTTRIGAHPSESAVAMSWRS
jgi:hypothetical protein